MEHINSLKQPSHIALVLRAKRIVDLIGAAVGMLILAMVFPFIALAIKWDSAGPIFYRQLRVGVSMPDRMTLIYVLKFRTMVSDAESVKGAQWATKDDPRITRVGRFLRKSRLDELPQFINVLAGDMSLIGPRPERPDFYQNLESNIPFFTERTYGVLPGITGLAQVNQGYDACIEDVRSKVGFDHGYALSLMSFRTWILTDVSIIFKTLSVMVNGRGQ
ncbi:sugar transferase [Vibrio hippocampi]|uniref:UDP-N-acetylgalactosamine-undecaprenyl-phosphate N-acetylgalactosaminephosphotransferase n=1 Tax=Vibrio hippocampi TaxID=654686 RepID=A0ABM8ZN21_9VIBR|nr:sugar transferase [Vibrio hippocampi]CAH0529973.1 UDP-N-acetylgalactosamine-undecaprenyl-phosphate N-acetylgalactosaminephosphotransferase [Vibrio hippocampi]